MNSNSTDIGGIRKFGIIALVFFGALCGLGVWTGKPVPIFLFGILALLGLGFILIPRQLRPIHALWLRAAHFLGRLTTTLVLTLAYYLVITPSALIIRVFGRRLLPVKPDKGIETYWVTRSESAQPRERFVKRY